MVGIDRNIITKSFSDFLQKVLAKSRKTWYYIKADWFGKLNIRVWRSLVSRLNGVQEALSSNLNTRTRGVLLRWYSSFLLFGYRWRTQGLHCAKRSLNPGPMGIGACARFPCVRHPPQWACRSATAAGGSWRGDIQHSDQRVLSKDGTLFVFAHCWSNSRPLEAA